ncbi:MAG TPA: YfiR family protein [Gammaproteobacteria bacterium]
MTAGNLVAQTPVISPTIEYQVKASLVFNFLHFVEWPEDIFKNASDEITICMIGPNVYGRALKVLEGEVAQGKRLTVRLHTEGWFPALAETCRVAIFAEQTPEAAEETLPILADRSVLTIGETSTFLSDGGIIKFKIVNETVQFEINHAMAKRARLMVSSKLLRLATNVIDGN